MNDYVRCKQDVNLTQLVSRLGKYLYKNIDGAYKIIDLKNNSFDIYMIVLYQIPYLPTKPGKKSTSSDIQDMNLKINVTTYADKIRVNITEIDEYENTLVHFVVPSEYLKDMKQSQEYILNRIRKTLNKLYLGYDFLF